MYDSTKIYSHPYLKVDPENLREYLKVLSKEPHIAAGKRDKYETQSRKWISFLFPKYNKVYDWQHNVNLPLCDALFFF